VPQDKAWRILYFGELPRSPCTGSLRFPRTLLLGRWVNKGKRKSRGCLTQALSIVPSRPSLLTSARPGVVEKACSRKLGRCLAYSNVSASNDLTAGYRLEFFQTVSICHWVKNTPAPGFAPCPALFRSPRQQYQWGLRKPCLDQHRSQ
jgi:hypothetical protein